jgi:hypothetical protein
MTEIRRPNALVAAKQGDRFFGPTLGAVALILAGALIAPLAWPSTGVHFAEQSGSKPLAVLGLVVAGLGQVLLLIYGGGLAVYKGVCAANDREAGRS